MRCSVSSRGCSCWRRRSCSRASRRDRSTERSSPSIWPSLALFAAATFGRAAAAWGFEVVGRRAATDVLADLRLDVVDGDLDGESSADVATLAVGGVDALETTFARYLPQVVLALVVPVAVLVLVAAIDPVSAGIMLLTLPLVPVFMWLVGRHTERRARERWRALSFLATHFLDVVRGLPTLRAFNRGEAQAGADRRGERPLPRRDDGHASDRVPLGRGAGAGRDARDRARRRDRRSPARQWRDRVRVGACRARACARALSASAEPRRAVPRERGRPRGDRTSARAGRAAP